MDLRALSYFLQVAASNRRITKFNRPHFDPLRLAYDVTLPSADNAEDDIPLNHSESGAMFTINKQQNRSKNSTEASISDSANNRRGYQKLLNLEQGESFMVGVVRDGEEFGGGSRVGSSRTVLGDIEDYQWPVEEHGYRLFGDLS